ncbi:MAG: hypothetical protein AMS21_04715, partial [Gemmatimonas sp. SG8_38_2]
VGLVVSFASYMDETAAAADLILPDHTPLESWGDQQPQVGVHGLMQPTVNPLFDTKHTGDVLMSLASRVGGAAAGRFQWPDYQAYLKDAWQATQSEFAPREDFQEFWRAAVSRGGVWRDVGTQAVTINRAVSGVYFEGATGPGQ